MVVKRKLTKCLSRAYSELIRLDIPGSSGSKSSRPSTMRPSPPSIMKFSHDRPPVVKPTKGELQAQVETLSRRSRSVKRKPQDSLERSHPTWGKAPRLGTSSSLPFAHVRVQGQVLPSPVEVQREPNSNLALPLLPRPKIPRGGLLSLRWRLCPSQFGVLLRRELIPLLR